MLKTMTCGHAAAVMLVVVCLNSAMSVAAETEAEETERYKLEAVEQVVASHDNALILKGGELMVRQQAVHAAAKLLSQ